MIIQNNNFDIIIFELNKCCTALTFNYPRKKNWYLMHWDIFRSYFKKDISSLGLRQSLKHSLVLFSAF